VRGGWSQRQDLRMEAVPRTVADLAADLTRLGVRPGELLMVHASLRAIGPVRGGASGVIDAIGQATGPSGTMLMTLGARDDLGWVNDRPEEERADLLAGSPPFDCLTAPADPDVGVLAEVFRTTPGTLVSDHPEGRFGARGELATALVSDVPWDDYYGPGSPLERFVQHRGRVLRLGADPDTVTLLHYGEYLATLPHKRRVRRHRLVSLLGGGSAIRAVECLDDSEGIVEWTGDDYFALILRAYLAAGRGTSGRVGGARSELLDGADLVRFGAEWMSTNLAEAARAR
jgi:aminoglycoside 3-N-acetyltransferase